MRGTSFASSASGPEATVGTMSKPVTCTALLDYSVDEQLTVVLANHVCAEAIFVHTGLKEFFAWIFRHCNCMHC